MKTLFLQMGQYDSRAVIPLETVRADYFPHLSMDQFLRKIGSGEIKLPVVRAGSSQKAAKGVHLEDLAAYLDDRRSAAARTVSDLWHAIRQAFACFSPEECRNYITAAGYDDDAYASI